MSLTSRIALAGSEGTDPEDFLSESLGVVFPDDATAAEAVPAGDDAERRLFSHFLWNSSLLLAELIERDSYLISEEGVAAVEEDEAKSVGLFDVRGRRTLELGAGTALPSIMGGLLGAEEDQRQKERDGRDVPLGRVSLDVRVLGHEWGTFPEGDGVSGKRHAFDRVLICDCLWMPWQHGNLQRSVDFLLKQTAEARCWVVAGFHTGRAKMAGFFDEEALREEAGCEIEKIWEQDCDGKQRKWVKDKAEEDSGTRKRWLVVAVLKRAQRER
uniref:Nicotinamide N-methyltransferase n=1 Tax=Bionectria ochroleuca TaxID=29856 RepID=A0A8H7KER3_BIOOC